MMFFTGIDWSDQHLDYCLRTPEGKVLTEGQVTSNPQGMSELFAALDKHAPPEQIAIAMETTHAAWVQPLLDRGYRIYPVHSAAVENFRKSQYPTGSKSDKIDRRVLADYLATFHTKLRCLSPDAPAIVALRLACQDRLRLTQERVAKANELLAVLKTYYPASVALFKDLDTQIALEFLKEFPTQQQMQAFSSRRLTGWLKRHHYPCPARLPELLERHGQPVLPVAEHLQQAKAPLIRYLAGALLDLKALIVQRDKDIYQDFSQLPESRWAASLPGAGVVLGPAVLAIFGRDPNRFTDAAEARALMGTAPVTETSGKSRWVHFRMGCWKFARRTLQLLADMSRASSSWAQEFYQQQRKSHSHHQALRALAHKWVKIILALKRTGRPYEDAIYCQSLARYRSGARRIQQ
jgi:transposase